MKIRGYELTKEIGNNPCIRLYIGRKEEEEALIKVARDLDGAILWNDDRRQFNRIGSFLPAAKWVKLPHDHACLPYDDSFAQLIEWCITPDEKLWATVFRLGESRICDLTTLSELQRVKIDIRTGAWILERLLRVYEFYEAIAEEGDNPIIEYPKFSEGDFLVDPRNQRLLYYNYSGPATDLTGNKLIKEIAKRFRKWIIRTDEAPEIISLLAVLEMLGTVSFDEAYVRLRRLRRLLWGDQPYPFTYRKPGSKTWRTLEPR